MPKFEDFIDHAANVVRDETIMVATMSKRLTKAKGNNITREQGLMAWSFGPIYAGELPKEVFSKRKRSLKDIKSDAIYAKKYELSPRACRGVLKRDEGRGKPLPDRIKEALTKRGSDE